ncbi:MAG: 3-methyl-2-oxobutanoate hydroxymethyltransferase [candidate division Zixibacteria bacterium]|nr:3-methyl-2-oxobutanoate hydroxymethyltransferase [candidate division Zixibacteria bacterium]
MIWLSKSRSLSPEHIITFPPDHWNFNGENRLEVYVKSDKVTAPKLVKKKGDGEKIVFLTAYDYFTAKQLDAAGVDGLLVGDSLNMVVYGHENTLSLPLDQILYHTEAVSRAAKRALVVGDMPFMSYQASLSEAVWNAGRFLKEAGAHAVKLEGGIEMIDVVMRIVESGIPVMGHIGLTPQSIFKFGGYRVQGKEATEKNYLFESAEALQEAGCFAVVLEAVKSKIAEEITGRIDIPTIGIGAGPGCDGQIMVINDLMGMDEDFYAKFVRRYFNLGQKIREVGEKYADDVRSGDYPSKDESY